MYETLFGLRQRPFRATLDLDSYYPATGHEGVQARLLRAIADDEGWALLSGEVGTGKSPICHCLLQRLGAQVTSAFLTNSHVRDRAGLLQAILYDLSLPYQGLGEQELRLALTDFLLRNYTDGRRTVVVIDEAQHLTPDLLEELRLLTNLESPKGKTLQVVLVGQPSLVETLRLPELAALSQRIAVRLWLEPLGPEEAADYLLHQLRTAGGRAEAILSDEAREILATGTRGVPRLLNQAAHQALLLTHDADASAVDAEAALEALALLGLEEVESLAPLSCAEISVRAGPVSSDAELAAEPPDDAVAPEPNAAPLVLAAREAVPAERLLATPRRPA